MQNKEKVNEPKFIKEQIVNSKHFTVNEKDILNALLSENERYSIDESREVIERFYKKEVK